MTVRMIFDPNRGPAKQISTGAPRGHGKSVIEARTRLAGYLDEHLPRPLHFNDVDAARRVEQAIDTMTPAERVYLEIDMQSQAKVMHSSDYDPLR